ncbi:hypothetical protein [Nostoc sp. 'Lobaria pulmonaria (5183) cyanobiont']|uniref:hypothetical protein n=1 Tax=Nostoc sp. 'Lobaria pulmonaria (5183) cyanobiont' TaxID=1618022 RepID=UPI0018F8AD4A|nr:hypothetical protein [Nostoc sp. 'Lobaria pulmonaria (5183) cyanobiont']
MAVMVLLCVDAELFSRRLSPSIHLTSLQLPRNSCSISLSCRILPEDCSSNRNGGATPTVFDFKSDLPGSPKVTSLEMTNSPLARIEIKVPATATLITPAPTTGSGNTPIPPLVIDGNAIAPAPVVSDGNAIASSTPATYTSESNSPSLSTTPNMEFSNGNSLEVNQVVVNPATLAQAACSQDYAKSCTIPTSPKQAIGPRSRVLVR